MKIIKVQYSWHVYLGINIDILDQYNIGFDICWNKVFVQFTFINIIMIIMLSVWILGQYRNDSSSSNQSRPQDELSLSNFEENQRLFNYKRSRDRE